MINCDEATTICDKSQYCEATLWERIKLRMHLFFMQKNVVCILSKTN